MMLLQTLISEAKKPTAKQLAEFENLKQGGWAEFSLEIFHPDELGSLKHLAMQHDCKYLGTKVSPMDHIFAARNYADACALVDEIYGQDNGDREPNSFWILGADHE